MHAVIAPFLFLPVSFVPFGNLKSLVLCIIPFFIAHACDFMTKEKENIDLRIRRQSFESFEFCHFQFVTFLACPNVNEVLNYSYRSNELFMPPKMTYQHKNSVSDMTKMKRKL